MSSRHMAGLRAWLWQRLTALFMGVYLLIFVTMMLYDPPRDFQDWHDAIASPSVALPMMLFFAGLLLHAWVGIRDVIIDYIHSPTLRLFKLSLTALALVACGFWVANILLTVMR